MINSEISIVAAHNIDRKKWNGCVDNSSNCLIYGLTDYLDKMTANWTGIIVNDYEAVLPVPWKKKFGIRYAYAVPFIQQLGLFSKSKNTIDENILRAVFSVCSYGEYYFNHSNVVQGSVQRINYILRLNSSAEKLFQSFSSDVQQIFKRTATSELIYTAGDLEETVESCRTLYGHRSTSVTPAIYQNFTDLCKIFLAQKRVILRKATDAKGTALAYVLLLQYGNRLYNMMNGTTPEGRKVKANHFLLSNVWKEFATGDFIFDFEGSELPGVKEFYEKFSPENEPYFALRFNHLRFPLNVFKK